MLPSPWRPDFPALSVMEAAGLTYLDSAATAQKPQSVIDALTGYYTAGTANVHRAGHAVGERVTEAFEATRGTVARWMGAADPAEIVFTRNATEAFNLVAYGLEHRFSAGDEIVISALEHHANLLPWQQLAARSGLTLRVLPLHESGHVDLEQAATVIGDRTRLLAVSQLSNVLGTWQPVQDLIALARQQGALTVIDGAQGAVHQRPDVHALGCDFYVFSGHKLYAPEGVGVLYGRTEALAYLRHWQYGGEMVRHAEYHRADFNPAPLGFEAGTPAIGAVLGLGAAIDYLFRLDPAGVRAHEAALLETLLRGLRTREDVQVLGSPDAALACFTVADVHATDLAYALSEQGIAVRAGRHCATPLYQHLGASGAIRVSLALYNDTEDLDRFFRALDKALNLLK
ncbi:aminotransferase class V-fold PLP-dependent enzyme [Pseudomonas matsuisoli]|uniref:cysteine desulfurase n=1 Tax=Pseudomonas matsuisoli TaxID=1515666 RepID=A0A917USG5_9PSED|nr:aminotransferase class V-fold PLP-dependent enzyme [Pseudomonas matsuisoli]GGJ81974.1 putative cysteine desulfurase [Pseudomonas matsuisoli]